MIIFTKWYAIFYLIVSINIIYIVVMYSVLVNKVISVENLSVEYIFNQSNKIYTFLNPVSYLLALENKELYKKFDGIFADGSLLVAAIKLLYGKTVTRRSFDMSSIASDFLSFAEDKNKSIYIVASQKEQVRKAVEIFKERYPKLYIIGYRDGYFASMQDIDMEAKKIVDINPDFLIVGMGVLLQENFLVKVKCAGFQGIGFTCGGFIHQTSNREIDYYPKWIDRMNLRFIYRIYREKHTRKRYLQAAFLFPARFVFERFFEKRNKYV